MAYDSPPARVKPDHNEVHVWWACLDDAADQAAAWAGLLSEAERERAGRFVQNRDRCRYVVSRAILKTLIMSYAGLGLGKLRYSSGARGKPRLEAGINGGGLGFSMSRSAGYGMFAFSKDREIGIDIEQIREIPEMEQIVGSFFSAAEQRMFARLPAPEKKRAFFADWTRKEALAKALGVGLSIPLNRLSIPLNTEDLDTPLHIGGSSGCAGHWTIRDVSPSPGFSAALAVEGGGFKILGWHWGSRSLAKGAS